MKNSVNSAGSGNYRMIIGVGTDIIEISRIRKLMEQHSGGKFAARVLTEEELELLRERGGKQAEFVAGRFAAKEAVVKAIGCGIGKQVGFHDIAILPDFRGKPECILSFEARYRLAYSSKIRIHISITHSEQVASAFAVIESSGELDDV